MRSILLSSIAVVMMLMAGAADAWGPVFHYYTTCTVYGVPLENCTATAVADLLSGTEMPDAYFFTPRLLSSSTDSSRHCNDRNVEALHSPLLAGYMYLLAPRYNTATFNATNFAAGFGMHVAADAAGFYQHGYLGSGWGHGYTPAAYLQADHNWLSLWPFMEAIDVYVYQNQFAPLGVALPSSGVPSSNNETARFVAAAIESAIANGTDLPRFTPEALAECANEWQAALVEEAIKVQLTPAVVAEFELLYNDKFGAQNLTQAAEHLRMATECAMGCAGKWLYEISQPGTTPTDALYATVDWLMNEFRSGHCTPKPSVVAEAKLNKRHRQY